MVVDKGPANIKQVATRNLMNFNVGSGLQLLLPPGKEGREGGREGAKERWLLRCLSLHERRLLKDFFWYPKNEPPIFCIV